MYDHNSYDPARTLLIFVHGGGWTGGDKDAPNFAGMQEFADQSGYYCRSINYTLATPEQQSFPIVMWDVEQLRRVFVKELQPTRTFYVGSSAGANIAALSAYWYRDKNNLSGFIGFYGAYNLRRSEDFNAEVNRRMKIYLGPRGAWQASPPPLDIPMLLIHGTKDKTVLPVQSERMGKTLLVDEKHAFKIFNYSDRIIDFIINSHHRIGQ